MKVPKSLNSEKLLKSPTAAIDRHRKTVFESRLAVEACCSVPVVQIASDLQIGHGASQRASRPTKILCCCADLSGEWGGWAGRAELASRRHARTLPQDYNIREFILRRVRADFRRNRTATGDELARLLREVRQQRPTLRTLRHPCHPPPLPRPSSPASRGSRLTRRCS